MYSMNSSEIFFFVSFNVSTFSHDSGMDLSCDAPSHIRWEGRISDAVQVKDFWTFVLQCLLGENKVNVDRRGGVVLRCVVNCCVVLRCVVNSIVVV